MASHIERRKFLATLGGAAATWPLAARAQQMGKLPTIGFLGGGTPASQRTWAVAFVQRLRELGWNEGRTVAVEYRWGEGRTERYAEIAAEFVRLKVDIVLAAGTEPALAAKQATSVIPIVFSTAGDPVGTGLVASLARPGGNVTGLSNLGSNLAAKRLQLLREVFPKFSRLAVMANAGYSGGVTEMALLGGAAAAWPLGAKAQQPGKTWRTGFIAHGHERFYDALFEGLREPGYTEGFRAAQEKAVQWAAPEERRDACLNHVCFSARSTRRFGLSAAPTSGRRLVG